jgi:predicted NodU family carbamoyl transferase
MMSPPRNILGISAYYHDAAAALVIDGKIVSAAQEERFTRKKNDPDFPLQAAQFCLRHANLAPAQLDAVVFYDKPILKFTRLLETYLAIAPAGWRTFPTVMSNWLGGKLDVRKLIRSALPELRPECGHYFHAWSGTAFAGRPQRGGSRPAPGTFSHAAVLYDRTVHRDEGKAGQSERRARRV